MNGYDTKVSIVLPTYNGGKYIRESIESILGQTFKEWELIIVDDCSTDESGRIAEEYADRDDRVRVIHNEVNSKLPESLNIGFREARGEYLSWTSDDNIFLSHAIEEMREYLDTHPEIAMVCAGQLNIDEKNRILGEREVYEEDKMPYANTVGACFMYRQSIKDRIGEYDTELFCIEDKDYWVRILQSGNSISYLKGCYYLYRVHDAQLTTTKREYHEKQWEKFFYKHEKWVMDGVKDNTSVLMMFYNTLVAVSDKPLEIIKESFIPYTSLIEGDEEIVENRRIIMYGAGMKGKEASELIRDNEVIMCDKSAINDKEERYGHYLCTPAEMVEIAKKTEDIQIVITLGHEKQEEVIKFLRENGINKYSVMGHVYRYVNRGMSKNVK